MNAVRIWDLPTRLFHWALAACVIALVATAKIGGDAMNWHFRLGYAVFTLLLFRLLWGLVGGHWSRFASFLPTPGRLARYLGGRATAADTAGHSPLGALSVLTMLTVLSLQVATGLFTDDEIAFAGPLTALVPGSVVSTATTWHKSWGQYLVLGLVLLHVLAIIAYRLRQQDLVTPMVRGDKQLAAAVQATRDNAGTRLLALGLLAACAGVVYWVVQLGQQPMLG
ncbi:cytochrome b/b6 domain-containing protein [Ottowia testudinis]|uniref:Cytochrome b/b6 domain-containing protein n=1 Tax=Ottowia testudinis TaxID=2816950 RepID=A0A975H3G4_9BURK|nr:cytochrome b/b6 domain-containing protein [Ottowia testudinis]QTD45240.1 cytochrome b/b6 domain-containing protein [Ottowia testudinis]